MRLLESEEPEKFFVRTLLCGDKGVLLFVLPRKEGMESNGRANMRIRRPGYSLCEEGYEFSGNEGISVTPADPQHYVLNVPVAEQARLYFIPSCP